MNAHNRSAAFYFFFLIVTALSLLSPYTVLADEYRALGETSGSAADALLGDLLLSLPFSNAIELASGISVRPEPPGKALLLSLTRPQPSLSDAEREVLLLRILSGRRKLQPEAEATLYTAFFSFHDHTLRAVALTFMTKSDRSPSEHFLIREAHDLRNVIASSPPGVRQEALSFALIAQTGTSLQLAALLSDLAASSRDRTVVAALLASARIVFD